MSDPSDEYEMGKAILHHLHLDDRHPGNGPSKIVWVPEFEMEVRQEGFPGGYAILVKDLAPLLEMYINLLPTFDGDGDC